MSHDDRQRLLSAAREALDAALPNAWATYVYGSFSRGDERPDSDIDLGVLLPPGDRIPDVLEVMASVSKAVGRDVDLVDLREAGLDLIADVLRDGHQLVVRDPARVLEWEAERMTDYGAFNPRRTAILSRYLREPLPI